MGLAMEVISGYVTSTTGTGTADPVTNASGDTTAVRNYNPGAAAYILDQWASTGADLGGSPGPIIQQIKSPRMHDNVNGVQVTTNLESAQTLWPAYNKELVYAQDVLGVNMIDDGGGGAGPIAESMLMFYTDLPGSAANLHAWAEVQPRIVHAMGVEVTTGTVTATPGDYDGEATIVSLQDQFKANRWYAILGATVDLECATIGIRSPDFANYRVGLPGAAALPIEGRDFFVRMSQDNGLPCIPCFNASNKFATVVDVTDPGGNGPFNLTIYCALLN